MTESAASLEFVTHLCCWTWAWCFSAAPSSENDQGSMNLATNTAPWAATMPSSVAPIHRFTGWRMRRWTSVTACPVLRSYQSRFSGSVTTPSWTRRLSERSCGSLAPPPLPPQERQERWLVVPHDDAGVRAADERTAIDVLTSRQLAAGHCALL